MTATNTTKAEGFETRRLKQAKRRAWLFRITIFFASALLATGVLVYERSNGIGEGEFQLGEPAPRSLFAPVAVTYENAEKTSELKQKAADLVPVVFSIQRDKDKEIRAKLDVFLSVLERAKITQAAGQDPGPVLSQLPFFIPDAALKTLLAFPAPDDLRKHFELLLTQSLQDGLIARAQKEELRKEGRSNVSVRSDDQPEKQVLVEKLVAAEESREAAGQMQQQMPIRGKAEREAILDLFEAVIQPNASLDLDEIQKRRKIAQDSVATLEEHIKKNELVVQRGMLVTAADKLRVDMIAKKIATKKALSRFGAVGLLVLLTYLFGFLYMLFFEPRILASVKGVLLIHTILAATLIGSRLLLCLPFGTPYLMPVALAAVLMSLLVNPRIGILTGVVMALLASAMVGFRVDILMAALFASTAGVFASLRVRKRIQFLAIGAAVGAAYFATIFSFRIFEEYSLQEALMIGLQGLGNGFLITTSLAVLLLPLLEWAFDLVTDVTLLELSDLNHPVLKRMIVEAPGTYHHSLVVSTLAESACQRIGANALLARVGCYFHDIGKIARAEYFTENLAYQKASQHEKLTPTMSCLVIMNHVKDGIELGRKYKLREPILRFIPEHQGTGVIYYFYKKALDAAEKGQPVNVEDFRYPGPKPQTRETAVAMLADSTEAASRSLKTPNPEDVRHLVRKIINEKFIDGQLDECPLTLRDLHKIQESFVQNLLAIFHTRVSYPAKPEAADRPDLFESGQHSKYRSGQ